MQIVCLHLEKYFLNTHQHKAFAIFSNKKFLLFIFVRFFLTLAIQMQMATIGFQVYYEFKKDELFLGLIALNEAIPYISFSFISGYVADFYNRKNIIRICILSLLVGGTLLLLLCLPQFAWVKSYGVTVLFSIVFLFGIIRAFIAAAIPSFLSELIDRSNYTQASTWNSTAWHSGAILGPVLAGILYGIHNENNAQLTYTINLILFLIVFILFSMIQYKPSDIKPQKESITSSLKTGLQFVFKNKMLLSALSLDLFAVLFGGAVSILPAFSEKILHEGAYVAGWLRAAPAIGAVCMALIMAFYPPRKHAGKALLIAVIAFGVFTILFALSTNIILAFVMLALTGAFDNISVVVRHTILQLMTPNEMRGRVAAVNNIFIGSSNEIGGAESGVASKLMGLVPSIIFGGCATIAVVIGINFWNKDLKKLDTTKLE